MKIFLTLLSLYSSIPQILFAFIWTHNSGDGADAFTSTLQSFHGVVPTWTDFAFSMGIWWYGITAIIATAAVVVYFNHMSWWLHLCVSIISIFTTLAMCYAMYPLHLIMA